MILKGLGYFPVPNTGLLSLSSSNGLSSSFFYLQGAFPDDITYIQNVKKVAIS